MSQPWGSQGVEDEEGEEDEEGGAKITPNSRSLFLFYVLLQENKRLQWPYYRVSTSFTLFRHRHVC
jgi:hypothetical protein